MARAHEDVDCVFGFKHHAVGERDTHAAAHPVARLEAASAVLDDFVGKNEKRDVAGGLDFGQVIGGDVGVKDCPLLDEAVRLSREASLNLARHRFLAFC